MPKVKFEVHERIPEGSFLISSHNSFPSARKRVQRIIIQSNKECPPTKTDKWKECKKSDMLLSVCRGKDRLYISQVIVLSTKRKKK